MASECNLYSVFDYSLLQKASVFDLISLGTPSRHNLIMLCRFNITDEAVLLFRFGIAAVAGPVVI